MIAAKDSPDGAPAVEDHTEKLSGIKREASHHSAPAVPGPMLGGVAQDSADALHYAKVRFVIRFPGASPWHGLCAYPTHARKATRSGGLKHDILNSVESLS